MNINQVAQLLTIDHVKAYLADSEKWLWVDYNVLCDNNLPCTERNVHIIECRLMEIRQDAINRAEQFIREHC
jgi:hypothetical protein